MIFYQKKNIDIPNVPTRRVKPKSVNLILDKFGL